MKHKKRITAAIMAAVMSCSAMTAVMPALTGTAITASAAASLSISSSQMSLGKGESVKLTANQSVTWRTSAPKILTVDKNGNVKAVGTGTAWITARSKSGSEKSCKITVKKAPTWVGISQSSLTMGVGETFTLSANVASDAGAATRTFRTSNSGIVKMTKTNWTGSFTAVKPGTAWVTVRLYNGLEKSCKITVKKAPTWVGLTTKNMTLTVGQTGTLGANIASDAGCATRTFRTSNSGIVKMTRTNWTGQFKAVKPGTAWVTVRTYNGKEASCKVTVKAPVPKVDDYTNNIKAALAKEAVNGKISLKVWCSGDDLKFEKSRIEEFKKKYAGSGYTFDIKVIGSFGEDSAASKIIESPSDGADVFSFADDQLDALIESGSIARMSDLFSNSVKNEQAWDAVTVSRGSDYNMYAFPKSCDNGYYLYYDKRVYKTSSDLATMDGMISKANANGKSVFLNLANPWYNAGFFFAAGVTIKYENGKQTALVYSDQGLNAAKAMCRLAEKSGKGFVGTSGTAGDNTVVINGFRDGTLAAAVSGSWNGPAIKDAIGAGNLGAAKLPTVLINGSQKQLHSFGGYKLEGVNNFSKYPVAAQTLAYYLTNADSQLKRYQQRGAIPTCKAVQSDSAVKNDPAFQAINAQKPYAHAQGKTTSGRYWASGIGSLGDYIVSTKGSLNDNQLLNELNWIQNRMS